MPFILIIQKSTPNPGLFVDGVGNAAPLLHRTEHHLKAEDAMAWTSRGLRVSAT